MSNIDSNIIDPGKSNPPPPDVIVPDEEPGNDHVGSDEVREPWEEDVPAIQPDPEESRKDLPNIRRQ